MNQQLKNSPHKNSMKKEKSKCYNDEFEASTWVWKHLWKPGNSSNQFVKFNILDVIQIDKNQIVGWLFTSTDGSIKSKTRGKWDFKHAKQRFLDENGILQGHLYDISWKKIQPGEDDFPLHLTPTARILIPLSNISKSFTWVEQRFEKLNGILAPKMSTYSLCSSNIKGKSLVESEEVIPMNRIINTNKAIKQVLQETTIRLINILEARSSCKINQLVCIFIVETLYDGTSKVWLHHATEIMLEKKPKSLGSSLHSETMSTNTDLTYDIGSLRKSKCIGDFCLFNVDDGIKSEDAEEDISEEAKKAIQRHKRVEQLERINESDENGSPSKSSLNESEDVGGNAVKISRAFTVPMKSILLARNEMKELSKSTALEYDPSCSWPPSVQRWFLRFGKVTVKKQLPEVIPMSSAYSIHKSILNSVLEPLGEKSSEDSTMIQPLTEQALTQRTKNNKTVDYKSTEDVDAGDALYGKKHLGYFYDTANVCETCYHVYCELDKSRNKDYNSILRHKMKEMNDMQSPDTKMAERYLQEEKQSYQRQLTERLSRKMSNSNLSEIDESSYRPSIARSHKDVDGVVSVLPPVPWRLHDQVTREKYQNQGSSFVKSIKNKAQYMQQEVMKDRFMADLENPDLSNSKIDMDWRKLVGSQYSEKTLSKSKSADSTTAKRKKPRPKPIKKFNPERLMHPWQRDLSALRKMVNGETDDGDNQQNRQIQMKTHHLQPLTHTLVDPSLFPEQKISSDKFLNSGTVVQMAPKTKKDKEYMSIANEFHKIFDTAISASMTGKPPHRQVSPIESPKKASHGSTLKSNTHSASSIMNKEHRDEDEDDDDDDEDGIGWSPFVVTS